MQPPILDQTNKFIWNFWKSVRKKLLWAITCGSTFAEESCSPVALIGGVCLTGRLPQIHDSDFSILDYRTILFYDQKIIAEGFRKMFRRWNDYERCRGKVVNDEDILKIIQWRRELFGRREQKHDQRREMIIGKERKLVTPQS